MDVCLTRNLDAQFAASMSDEKEKRLVKVVCASQPSEL